MNKSLDNQLRETQAHNLFNQKHFSLASIQIQKLLKTQPPNKGLLYSLLGDIHYEKNQHIDQIRQKYKKASFFNDPKASYSYARVLYNRMKPEESRAEVEKFFQSEPSDPHGLFLMVNIYLNLGLYEDADKIFIKLFKIDERYPGLYNSWACSYYSQEKFNASKTSLLRALGQDPQDDETHRLLGYTLLGEGKYKEANDCF